MKIYHVINPYSVPEGSEDSLVQSRTIDSINIARDFAAAVVDVEVVAKLSPDDMPELQNKLIDEGYTVAELTTSSADLPQDFKVPRELPVLKDLVDLTGLKKSEGKKEYVVFTNMDICLKPFFYTEVARLVAQGFETFVINRRTVDKELLFAEQSEVMFSDGEKHIGHDCFVLPRENLEKFFLRDHVLGIGFVFRPFLLNCILSAKNFHEFDDVYLTYHFGDDMLWKSDKYNDYLEHNKLQLIEVYEKFLPEIKGLSPEKRRWLDKFFSFSFLPRLELEDA